MKVSLEWLSELVDLSSLGPRESWAERLSEKLTLRGIEVEAIEPQGRGFESVVSARILERAKHPEADRLSLCKVDIGDGQGLEIVCGAQNMKAGDIVAAALIGAHLPNGLKIEKSKIRGVVSNGMLCSEDELGLFVPTPERPKSEGIMILPPKTELGQPLARVLGLTDTVLELKLTANRADCLSHYGLAREIAAALGKTVHSVASLETYSENPKGKSPVSIELDAEMSKKDAPQFYGASIEGIKIEESPAWVKKRLEACGSRSINTVVDATNLVLFELGHPVHAYDQAKLDGMLGVRLGEAGESVPLLDGTKVTLVGGELVIVTGQSKKPVGLAGVMGGGNSEVSATTKALFLEVAEFEPSRVRRASAKHQKKTEASHRFERGVDPTRLEFVLRRLIWWIQKLAGGNVVALSSAGQVSRAKLYENASKISLPKGYLSSFLGLEISDAEVTDVLTGLGCEVKSTNEGLSVKPPAFRLDLSLPEDLAEEVARSVGYDRIPETLPALSSPPLLAGPLIDQLEMKDRAKDLLARFGFHETLSFGFTSQASLEALGLKSAGRVLNPISESCAELVPSLLPGLLEQATQNASHHFGSEPLSIRLFELRTTFDPSPEGLRAFSETETGMREPWKLSWAMSGPRFVGGLKSDQSLIDFYDVKAVALSMLDGLGTRGPRLSPLDDERRALLEKKSSRLAAIAPLFHPGQSAVVIVGANDVVGIFGALHPQASQNFRLRDPLWIAEWDWELLSNASRPLSSAPGFKVWPDFPGMERDFALLVKEGISAERLTQVALKAGRPLAKSARVFDVYRGAQVTAGMTSVAVRVIFYEEKRSLQEAEVEQASQAIQSAWKKELGVELRS